jgi:tungstate transport system substrate-binding protein
MYSLKYNEEGYFMGISKKMVIIIVAIVVVAAIAGVAAYNYYNQPPPQRLIIATTTSTVDSGLLDYLKPYFDKQFHANMTWLYLGTGQAIAAASSGDADVLLVHSRSQENAFILSGNGTLRVTVMYNDFIIIGPPSDPANATGTNATGAMIRIAEAGMNGTAQFISRGDNSGTNTFELNLWKKAGINATGSWYLSAGAGMAPTIRIANEKGAYTITDRATYLQLQSTMNSTLNLVIICQSPVQMQNPYGVLEINATRYPHINSELGLDFILFLCSPEGQSLIGNYTINGVQVFHPIYGNPQSIGLPSEDANMTYLDQLMQQRGMM